MTILRQAGIEVETGILENAARKLNIGFVHRFEHGRPWIRCKLATSLDGATTFPKNTSQPKQDRWITGESARQNAHQWRARSAAIVSSARTVAADNARLNARPRLLKDQVQVQPLRILLDSRFALATDAAFFQTPGAKLWLGAQGTPQPKEVPADTDVMYLPTDAEHRLSLAALMEELARRAINELWVEAGPTLTASFLKEELVDELILYMAPRLLGNDTSVVTRGIPTAEEIKFEWKDTCFFGSDLRIRLKALRKQPDPRP